MLSLRSIRCGVLLLMAGLLHGVGRAATWFPLGPFGGDVRAFAADPADPSHHIFLGTATGWIYDSHDGGVTWTRISQIANRDDLAVDHILVDKNNPKRLIVGAWVVGKSTDGGIFISEDYGKAWYSQAEMRGQSVRSLARSPSNPSELVAGTLSGVFRSPDNGVHWQQISPAGSTEIHEIESVAFDPADANVIYAGTWHLPWKTTDGGVTWHNIKDGLIDDSDVFSIIVDPSKPNIVYASACSGIYKSTNSGDLFRKVQGIPSAARRTRKLAQDPEQLDTVFAGTTEGLYRSMDAGTQWERTTPPDVIVNDVYIDPSDSRRVLIATDRAGVYRSEDGGTTFDSSNAGFAARQVRAYAQDALAPNTLYVGLVNDKNTGGVFQSTDGAVHWQQQSQGLDGRDVFSLHSLSDGTLLAGTVHGIFRLADGTWTESGALEGVPPAVKSQTTARILPASHVVAVARPAKHGLPVRQGPPTRAVRVAAHPRGRVMPSSRAVAASHGVLPSRARSTRTGRQPAVAARAGGLRKTNSGIRIAVAHRAAPAVRGKARVLKVDTRARPKAIMPRPIPRTAAARAEPAGVARFAPMAPTGTGNGIAAGSGMVVQAKPVSSAGQTTAAVYTLAGSNGTVFAGTGQGLLRSTDAGQHWSGLPVTNLADIHFLALLPASAETDAGILLLAADLEHAVLSQDGGENWAAVPLPPGLTQIGAVGLDGEKNLWIGGREGVWYSPDRGTTWKTLRNLFLTQVDSLFYDAAQHRMLVTAANSAAAFSVQGTDHKVNYWDTGWKLRFVRPVGNRLVAATLFDGMVVQPEMVATPLASPEKGSH